MWDPVGSRPKVCGDPARQEAKNSVWGWQAHTCAGIVLYYGFRSVLGLPGPSLSEAPYVLLKYLPDDWQSMD